MSRGRFEPGARCVIVGDDPGYESNIGAMVTIREFRPIETVGGRVGVWTFDEASRPLLVGFNTMVDGSVVRFCVSDSSPWTDGRHTYMAGYPARYLLPIGGEDLGEEKADAAPCAVETA